MEEKEHKTVPGFVIKDSGQRTEFETGARRDSATGKGLFHHLPFFALEKVAKLCEAGTAKYGDGAQGQPNWQKGIPTHRYADSGLRHLMKFIRGDVDEDHLTAAAWNILCLLDTQERVNSGMLPKDLITVPTDFNDSTVNWEDPVNFPKRKEHGTCPAKEGRPCPNEAATVKGSPEIDDYVASQICR